MAELRALAGDIGLEAPETLIASGNLLFDSADPVSVLEERMEAALRARFGFDVPVLVRSGADWTGYLHANPFPEACRERPNLVMMALSKRPPPAGAAAAIEARAAAGERVRQAGGALWLDYGAGVGTSRLTPAAIDRAAGWPTTGRNWRTVLELGRRLGCPAPPAA